MGEFQRIDDLMSSYKPDSVVSKVNQIGSTVKVRVGEEVFRVIHEADAVSVASDGAFDMTIWPVVRLWDFEKGEKIPEAGLILKKIDLVGYRNIEFDDSSTQWGSNSLGWGST